MITAEGELQCVHALTDCSILNVLFCNLAATKVPGTAAAICSGKVEATKRLRGVDRMQRVQCALKSVCAFTNVKVGLHQCEAQRKEAQKKV